MAETAAAPLSGLSPRAIEGFKPNVISAGPDRRGLDLKNTLKALGKKLNIRRKSTSPANPDEGKDMGWNVGAAAVRDIKKQDSSEPTGGSHPPQIEPPKKEKPDEMKPIDFDRVGSLARKDLTLATSQPEAFPPLDPAVEARKTVDFALEHEGARLDGIDLLSGPVSADEVDQARAAYSKIVETFRLAKVSPEEADKLLPGVPSGIRDRIISDLGQLLLWEGVDGQTANSSDAVKKDDAPPQSVGAEPQVAAAPDKAPEVEDSQPKPIEVVVLGSDSEEERVKKIEAAIAEGKARGEQFALTFSGDAIDGPIIVAKIRANILGQDGVEGVAFTERKPGTFTLEIKAHNPKTEQPGDAEAESRAAGGLGVGEDERQARTDVLKLIDDRISSLKSQASSGEEAGVEPQPASVRAETATPDSLETKEEMEKRALGEIAQKIVDEGLDPERAPGVVNLLTPTGVEFLRKALIPKLFSSASEGQTPEVLGAYWNKWFADKSKEFKDKGMLTQAQRDQAEEERLRDASQRRQDFNRWVDWAEGQPVRDNEGNRIDAQREAVLVQRLEKIYPDLEGLPFNRILSDVLIAERLSPSEVNRILNRTGIPYERARAIREDISSAYALDMRIDDISKVPEEWRDDPGFQEFALRYTEESGLDGGKWISELRAREVSDNDRSWGQRMAEGLPKRRPLGPEREIKVGGSPPAPVREPRGERLYGVKGDALVPRQGVDRLVDLASREVQVGGRPLLVDGEVFQPGGRLAVTPEIPQDRDTRELLSSSGPEQAVDAPPAPSVVDRTADELLTQQFYGTVEERAERIKDGVNKIEESLKKIEERDFSVKDAEEVFANAEALVRNGMTGEGIGVLRLQDQIKDVLDSPRGLVVKAQFNEIFFEEVERYGQEDNLDGIRTLFDAARVLGFYKNSNIPGLNEEIDRVEGILGLNSPRRTPPPFPGTPAPDYT